MLVLAAAGAAVRFTMPITVIAVLLAVLVTSYGQVIAAHPDGGGAYAVAKAISGSSASLLAAAALVVDYVLTVAVAWPPARQPRHRRSRRSRITCSRCA